MVFYDAEVAMILAVLLAIVAAQKHAEGRLPEVWRRREDTWSPLYRFLKLDDGHTRLNYENNGKNTENRPQLRKIG